LLSCNVFSNNETLPYYNSQDLTPSWNTKNEHRITKFNLVDQNGKNFGSKSLNDKIYIANFFFTTCPGICPKMTTNMSLLQEAFKNDSIILLLSHSVTPEIDSVAVLKKYAILNKVDSKKWHLLTGSKNEIYALAKQQYFAGDSVGFYQTGNEFLHTENFILVDQKRRIRGVYNGTLLLEIDRIKEDILTLKLEAASSKNFIN
jgi:protein SCO1/2